MKERLSHFLRASLISLFTLLIPHVYATDSGNAEAISQRIAPAGKVCIEGQSCQSGSSTKWIQVAENKTSYSGRDPEKIYQSYCVACHMSGVAGAPRIGHANEWAPHIAKGMDTLLKDAISGIQAMPPKGMCSDCSDDELKHTIQYMIDKSR